MKRWLVTLAGGYAGAGALAFLLYRAAYVHTRHLRTWTDTRGSELARLLDDLRVALRDLRGEDAVAGARAVEAARRPRRAHGDVTA